MTIFWLFLISTLIYLFNRLPSRIDLFVFSIGVVNVFLCRRSDLLLSLLWALGWWGRGSDRGWFFSTVWGNHLLHGDSLREALQRISSLKLLELCWSVLIQELIDPRQQVRPVLRLVGNVVEDLAETQRRERVLVVLKKNKKPIREGVLRLQGCQVLL